MRKLPQDYLADVYNQVTIELRTKNFYTIKMKFYVEVNNLLSPCYNVYNKML